MAQILDWGLVPHQLSGIGYVGGVHGAQQDRIGLVHELVAPLLLLALGGLVVRSGGVCIAAQRYATRWECRQYCILGAAGVTVDHYFAVAVADFERWVAVATPLTV